MFYAVNRVYCSDEEIGDCVFFAQHIPEIVRRALWDGQFFVACQNSSDNVDMRRRGKTLSRFVRCFRGVEGLGGFGDEGGLRGVEFTRQIRTLPRQQLEVRYEDGEKPPTRLRSRFGCGQRWAGS